MVSGDGTTFRLMNAWRAGGYSTTSCGTPARSSAAVSVPAAPRRIRSRPPKPAETKLFAELLRDGYSDRVIPADPSTIHRRRKRPTGVSWSNHLHPDANLLKRVTEIVVELKSLQPEQLKAFFKWVSSSIKTASQSVAQVAADNAGVNLAPPPANSGINIVL